MAKKKNMMLTQTVINQKSELFDFTVGEIRKTSIFAIFFTLAGKSSIPHLLRYQWLAVVYYSFAIDALKLGHPRLLQHWGKLY